jgi:hypothetical protein
MWYTIKAILLHSNEQNECKIGRSLLFDSLDRNITRHKLLTALIQFWLSGEMNAVPPRDIFFFLLYL